MYQPLVVYFYYFVY